MPTDDGDDDEIIIIRRPGSRSSVTIQASEMTVDAREYLRLTSARVAAGEQLGMLDRWKTRWLLGLAGFG